MISQAGMGTSRDWYRANALGGGAGPGICQSLGFSRHVPALL